MSFAYLWNIIDFVVTGIRVEVVVRRVFGSADDFGQDLVDDR